MKILFLIPHLNLAASNRYRVYQYLPYLQNQGFETTVRPFVDTAYFYKTLYQPNHLIRKLAYSLRSTQRRLLDLNLVRKHDIVFIQRECLPFGPAILEEFISRLGKPIIYDFDDAVFLPNVSQANRLIGWLKFPSKTKTIIHLSNSIIAGNEYLRDYAIRFNTNTIVIPTSIDTGYYFTKKKSDTKQEPIRIGWVGGHTTLSYLHEIDDVLAKLSQVYRVQLIVVGGVYQIPGVEVVSKPWSLEDELNDLLSLDIGIMPMPDNPWTRGKCGFKAIQYFGVGIPALASPVGVNNQIIQHGKNGFLATTQTEWYDYLSMLIKDPSLRIEMGMNGRKTVEAHYSLKANAPKIVNVIQQTIRQNQ